MSKLKEPKTIFGANVRRLREAKDWTQQDLAEAIGFAKARISAYETGSVAGGKNGPQMRTVSKFARVFGCAPDELLKEYEIEWVIGPGGVKRPK